MDEKPFLLKYAGGKPGFSEQPEFMSRSFTQLKIAEPNKNLYHHQKSYQLAGENKSFTWQLNSNFLLQPIAYSNFSMAVVQLHHRGLPSFFDIYNTFNVQTCSLKKLCFFFVCTPIAKTTPSAQKWRFLQFPEIVSGSSKNGATPWQRTRPESQVTTGQAGPSLTTAQAHSIWAGC